METKVEWCKFLLKKFNEGGSKRVYDILTCDETWIYQYDLETKRQSSVWVLPGNDSPLKVRRTRSVGKEMVTAMFFHLGVLLHKISQSQCLQALVLFKPRCAALSY